MVCGISPFQVVKPSTSKGQKNEKLEGNKRHEVDDATVDTDMVEKELVVKQNGAKKVKKRRNDIDHVSI